MKRYADPYAAGFFLGLVLLASYAFSGRGVGVSGAFRRAAEGVQFFDPTIIGILAGGFLSALLAGRVRATVERGPNMTTRTRVAAAFGGGALMGVGAYLARGCTSGLALSGGALLAAGSWVFMLAAFAAGYAFAPLVRRAWR